MGPTKVQSKWPMVMASYVQINIIYIYATTHFGVYTPYTDHSGQKQRHSFNPCLSLLPLCRPGKHVSIPEHLKVDV
ncbi:hypothetical protein PVAP13_6NG065930 [Panicum virgatum]|uniref:Uncharacterized protein n=1 Tax=Panicum virgatum TaxID=38727 RepID=A0A8T0QUQ7_PANVG|nr:hypothetical protein PVAP13_6NG065930 [Panicum virgatum]